MSGMRVREFEAADADAVVALVRELQVHEAQYFDRMKPASEIGLWYLDYLLEDTAKYGGTLLVSEFNGSIAGYASLLANCPEESRDEVPYSFAYVGDLVVGSRFRRVGVGAALINACEERAKAAGQRWIRLSVLAANSGSRAFYNKCGYQEHLIKLEKALP